MLTRAGNRIEDVEYVLEKFPAAVEKLRRLSPLWRTTQPPGKEMT
jgi:hypothetical protein